MNNPGTPAVAILARCRCCGKFRNPAEFVHTVEAGYCWFCYEWHAHALAVFAGAQPRGCQECGRSYDELERYSRNGDVKFGLHRKDGIYQILGLACGCSDAYERKRLDMYGRTPDGERKKLMGAK
jgi:hypothetical protein